MLKKDVKVGETYQATVSGKKTRVRVNSINEIRGMGMARTTTRYACTNLATGRDCSFRSAAGFTRIRELVGASTKPTTVVASSELHPQKLDPVYSVVKQPEESPKSGLGARMTAIEAPTKIPHLIVKARAGTGKTTTLIEGLRILKNGFRPCPNCNTTTTDSYGRRCTHKANGYSCVDGYLRLTPSPQQQAIWDSMALSKDASSIAFVAFNKSIAEELQARVPEGVNAMTMHSMGTRIVRAAFNLTGRDSVNGFRVDNIMQELTGKDMRELRKFKPEFVSGTKDLVSLCKMNLVDASNSEALADLARYYDIELNGSASEVLDLVPRVLERCKDVDRDKCIDFDDMIWIPIALNLPVYQYGLLLIDEGQDLNRCQQALAKRAGKRLIFCGDDKQAIYQFAGSDSMSLTRLNEELGATEQGCQVLPLTVTRRCGKAIVAEAQAYVPDFEAHESNGEGKISYASYDNEDPAKSYHALVEDGDMLVCRVNAPLVSQCFRFLKQGRKAFIQGRDVGKGLISTIRKVMKGYEPNTNDVAYVTPDVLGKLEVTELLSRLSDWKEDEQRKENVKKNPSEARLIAVQDRYDCLCCFAEDAKDVDGVVAKIEAIFTDDKSVKGIRLSSIHKAKGLESPRVFFLRPKGAECPHPMAKTAWAKEGEYNLIYVATTRAIKELVHVTGEAK